MHLVISIIDMITLHAEPGYCLLFHSYSRPVFVYSWASAWHESGSHSQQTPPGTWHYRWHTDPRRAAGTTSCWRAWRGQKRQWMGERETEGKICTSPSQASSIFCTFILGCNMRRRAARHTLIYAAATVQIFTLFMQDDLLEWFPVAEQPAHKK